MEARKLDQDAEIAALKQLNRDYIASAQNSDVRRYLGILAEDFMSTNPDGSLADRTAFLERIARPAAYSNLKAHDVRIRVMGDLGIIHARTTFTKDNGQAGAGWYTDVYARRQGRWLAVAAHYVVR